MKPDNVSVNSIPPALPVMNPRLSEENLQQLAVARAAAKKVRRTVSVAAFDGWTIAIFAAISLFFGFSDRTNLVMGTALGVIAYVELRSASRVQRLEESAAGVLGYNQLALAGLIVLYAIWQLYHIRTGPPLTASLGLSDPELSAMVKPYEGMMGDIEAMIYEALIAFALLAQGGMALYYFSRRKHIRQYAAETPEWILAMQRSGMPI